MANEKRNITFENVDSTVVIRDGKVVLTFPKGVLSLHSDESRTDSVEVRLMGSRRNIMSFRYSDMTSPTATDANDAIAKLNGII